MTLKSERCRGRRSPVVHVLMPDGRVTEFKNRAIVVPEPGEHEPDVWATLVTSDGQPFVTREGRVAVVKVPALQLAAKPDRNAPMTWKDVVAKAGLSLSTVKRAVDAGELARPAKRGNVNLGC